MLYILMNCYCYSAIFTALLNCFYAEAQRSLFSAESPSYYFTKRSNLLTFARPLSIGDGAILSLTPVQRSLPGAVLRLRHLQRHRSFNKPQFNIIPTDSDKLAAATAAAATAAAASSTSSASSIQQLFGNLWWSPKKIRSLPTPQRSTLRRTKRMHTLALLRGFDNSRSVTANILFRRTAQKNNNNNNRQLENRLSRKKRLHSLSILRGYNIRPAPSLSQYRSAYDTTTRLQRVVRRSKKSLHNLAILRGYNAKTWPLMQYQNSPYESIRTQRQQRRAKRSLHNLSLLRAFNNKLIDRYKTNNNNNNNVEDEDFYASAKQPRVRRRSKRVHNLSLLRYDGKLFNNVFPSQDGDDLQQKRFEQKRFPQLWQQLRSRAGGEGRQFVYLY